MVPIYSAGHGEFRARLECLFYLIVDSAFFIIQTGNKLLYLCVDIPPIMYHFAKVTVKWLYHTTSFQITIPLTCST